MTMQIVKIKIDPASVKKNPHAGQTSFFVPGPWRDDGNGGRARSIQTVYTMSPGKPWIYSYLPAVMGCDECRTDFFHTQLEDEMDEDYDGNMYGSSTVCPYCHEHVDCVLEFEKIEDFLKKEEK